MKNIIKLLVGLLVMSISSVFAIDAPTNLKIDSFENNTASVSWDKVDGAYAYYLYYSTTSGAETKTYEQKVDRFIEETSANVENLDSNNTYYFSVVAISEEADESAYSNEVVSSTTQVEAVESETTTEEVASETEKFNFELLNVETLNTDRVQLSFNSELSDLEDEVRDFTIINLKDLNEVVTVLKTELDSEDKTKLDLYLENPLNSEQEYEITIIALKDSNDNNIGFGVDSKDSFTLKDGLISVSEEEKLKEKENELAAASEEVTPENEVAEVVEDKKEVESVLSTSEETKELPQTGPEHILLFILAGILTLVVFKLKSVKN